MRQLARIACGCLLLVVLSQCNFDGGDAQPQASPPDNAGQGVVFHGLLVNSSKEGYQRIFQSKRSDIYTHFQEVLAGRHNDVKEVASVTADDEWKMIELPSSLVPAAPTDKLRYDLATQQGVTFHIRSASPAFAIIAAQGDMTKVQTHKSYFGTFECSSATSSVSGTLELSGSGAVSAEKMVSYLGNGPQAFALLLDYSGPYPPPAGPPLHGVFRIGGLFDLGPSH